MLFSPGYYLSEWNGEGLMFYLTPEANMVEVKVMYGVLAKAGDLTEKWITLKPNGPDHPGYVHVKIRLHSDGTAHILHGPKELRGLHLHKLGSKGSQDKKKAAVPKPKKEETPEEKAARETKEAAVKESILKAQQRAMEAAHALTQSGHFQMDDETREKLASGKAPAIQAGLRRLEAHIIKSLVSNPELKNAILHPEDQVDVDDAFKPTATGSTGYQYSAAEEAEKQGFTPEDARAEHEKFLQDRIDAEQDEGKRKRMQKALERMRSGTKPQRSSTPRGSSKVTDETLKEKSDKARELLQATRALKHLQGELRKIRLNQDPDSTPQEHEALDAASKPAKGAPWDISFDTVAPEFAQELEAKIKDVAATDLTRSFLDALEEEPAHEWDYTSLRKAMRAPHATGAYAHLSNVALATLGGDVLDRRALDVLGVEAASKLIAHALKRDLAPEDHSKLMEALGTHHDQVSTQAMQQALSAAQAARADAEGMDIPPISSTTDATVIQHLLKEKRERLQEAHNALGNALGQVEAGAALNMALKRNEQHLLVNLGTTNVQKAALNLRALGLQDGDYEYHQDADNNLWVKIHPVGMDRLTPVVPAEEREQAERIKAIKEGHEDEDDWLPAGFTRYSAAAFDANPPKPLNVSTPPGFKPGKDPKDAMQEFIASRMADGWTLGEVSRVLRQQSFLIDWVPEDQRDGYFAALDELMPSKTSEGQYVDYDHLEAKHPELYGALSQLADGYIQKRHPGEASYSSQVLHDTPETRKALYMAVLADPKTQLGFKGLQDLTPKDQGTLRSYFLSNIAGLSPEALAQRKEEAKRALQTYDAKYPEPSKFVAAGAEMGMFGMMDEEEKPVTLTLPSEDRERLLKRMNLTQEGEHYTVGPDGGITLTPAGEKAFRPPPADAGVKGLERLNPDWQSWDRKRLDYVAERTGGDVLEWSDFLELQKTPQKAYEAIQEHMKGAFIERFAQHHANLTGKPLRTSKQVNTHGEALWSVADKDSYQSFKDAMQSLQHSLREREGGKFKAMGGRGALVDAFRTFREKQKAAESAQSALFGMADSDTHQEASDVIPHLERRALPRGVENRISEMLQHVSQNIKPHMNPVKLIPDMTMGKGTKFVKQQRAIKAIMAQKKLASWLGVGSGKTGVSIGAFTELHHRGEVQKGLFVVPSIVRNQFGEEIARMTEPGRFKFHAQDATFEERLKAYQDPGTHMISVTHQSFRDDMSRIMQQHYGLTEPELNQRFMQADTAGRHQMLSEALAAHNIPLHYLALDEGHDTLNRQGKQESMLSAINETALQLSKYGTLMTGSPLKNDESEVFDTLKKLDPVKFGDQEALRRKYGVDVFASKEGLKRLIDQHTYSDAVPSGTTRKVVWGQDGTQGDTASGHQAIELTPWQKAELQRVDEAYHAAHKARARGESDIEALKVLSPNSFDHVPEDQHHTIAKNLNNSLATLRYGAQARTINDAPAEHNAKIQQIVQLAHARRGKGGVVFAHSKKAVEEITRALKDTGHVVGTITGASSSDDKGKVRQAFDDKRIDIVVCSDAGAVGANLQKRGEWLVNHDLPMTAKTHEQRNARIDRLGQEKPIELHNLISNTDHDRTNYERLERKRALGAIFQGQHESLDDTGLGRALVLAGLTRGQLAKPLALEPEEEQLSLF
ncbi:helicase-related protein [Deinococcus cellulosilyticus]|uniref:Helicase C-terminal domain-containing protein n=1 Tax=Deinococcus cellulosilyticus (strain DSM 18568 / NBRC 106333 / KACC 11606 / 5516J-15) TaxID=1223518 RepID=A0A511N793_DEIC1|nr:DEAD/DEAH box helicase [Deinococcus cellulosilyticus]GEM48712.1 hypothetical protein DC3_43470 [Deinococcus cellulosilyticus NBRC 106333 = KACC 11606]